MIRTLQYDDVSGRLTITSGIATTGPARLDAAATVPAILRPHVAAAFASVTKVVGITPEQTEALRTLLRELGKP